MGLGGKVAIVTGSGRGIGRAIAIRLAQEGGRVVVVDKDKDTASSTAESIRAGSGQATHMVLDMTRGEDVRRMVQDTVKHFGTLDILVNNVGWWDTAQYFVETSDECSGSGSLHPSR